MNVLYSKLKNHNLDLKTAMLLLSKVFKTSARLVKHYVIDLSHFYTSPGLAWQACLKKTEVSLELLTDPDMLLVFERGTRGGIIQAVHRYVQVSNKYMNDKFDPGKESHYLQYVNANNLYGWAMSRNLPTGRFKCVENPDELKRNIGKLAKEAGESCLLEVDVS